MRTSRCYHLQSLTSWSRPGIAASLESLDISEKDRTRPNGRPVADSWEDEEDAASSASSDDAGTPRCIPNAPPPTPISPSARRVDTAWGEFPSVYSPQSSVGRSNPAQAITSLRPEKSTATAGRMIAGALGVKTPKTSEEAKAYERAVREKESKRIARERAERKMEEEGRQQARRQVWED
ncbi:MAG: hypothetical protein L6R42_001129 [Xanthoria sp. 1 TBL-2021]|nr:MAG: hypothetical protein L6R42_001129 [Xanthoria sp. 1 TBL-2021]